MRDIFTVTLGVKLNRNWVVLVRRIAFGSINFGSTYRETVEVCLL